MDTIILAFANRNDAPLPSLRKEEDEVYSMLSRREKDNHFRIHLDGRATRDRIAEYLNLYKDQIIAFHYSGHAGEDFLLLEDETANASGIFRLLAQCPRLKLVLLNGCSTEGQVDQLLQLETNPVVLATSAPVGDHSATLFSITFYQEFCEQNKTVEQAFESAAAAAQIAATQDISPAKGILSRKEVKQPVWGIFYNNDLILDWKLPIGHQFTVPEKYEPNEVLMDALIQSLANYDDKVAKINKAQENGEKPSLSDKRVAILECLPHPISEQIRKLITPQIEGSAHTFFDRLGIHRFKQLGNCYKTIIKLLAFSQLAQLWDEMNESGNLNLSDSNKDALRNFLGRVSNNNQCSHLLKIIELVLKVFKENKVEAFVKELQEQAPIFDPQSNFSASCTFMERFIQKDPTKISEGEVNQLCIQAESHLGTILQALGFIANYTIASIKSIDVIKYRHSKKVTFKHKMVKLIQRFVGLEEEDESLESYLDTASVLLLRKEKESADFLNLSPFVIDENAFEGAPLTKLHYFQRYVKNQDAYAFSHIYKPDEFPLIIQKQSQFKIIKEQFDTFATILFNQPMTKI